MDQKKINEILRSHEEWVTTSGGKGKRADFHGLNLCCADLEEADLSCANFCDADLKYANLRDACLYKADLHGAYISRAYLRDVDFCGADLRDVDFCHTNLCNAYFSGADLRGANFCGARLREANLYNADFHNVNLRKADLHGTILPKGIYTAGGVGSEQRNTYYDAVNDQVICGCWDDADGNHLDSFKKRIEDVYGENGNTPNQKHYKAYQAVINYFESCRDAYKDEEWE